MMFSFLAAAGESLTPTGVEFAVWMGCAYFALKVWNEGQVALGKSKTPQPLVVTGEVKYATHEEVVQLRSEFTRLQESWKTEFSELEDKIDENYRESIKAGESRATKIHNRINEIIDNQPRKIIELLRNTGALTPLKK